MLAGAITGQGRSAGSDAGALRVELTADRKSRSQSGRVTGVRGRGFGEMRERCAAIMTRNWLQAIFVALA